MAYNDWASEKELGAVEKTSSSEKLALA